MNTVHAEVQQSSDKYQRHVGRNMHCSICFFNISTYPIGFPIHSAIVTNSISSVRLTWMQEEVPDFGDSGMTLHNTK
jgi:hypothetical protein